MSLCSNRSTANGSCTTDQIIYWTVDETKEVWLAGDHADRVQSWIKTVYRFASQSFNCLGMVGSVAMLAVLYGGCSVTLLCLLKSSNYNLPLGVHEECRFLKKLP